MKLLYLSCHEILEYDEVKLFTELGIKVFSPGAYVEPGNRGDGNMRPSIPGLAYDPDDVAAWHALGTEGRDNKTQITKEFADRFDAIMIMHIPHWVSANWKNIRHKPVIWRTIGQSISNNEQHLAPYRADGLKIVRYSPKERTIPGFIGEDAMIRFYKDPAEYGSWSGDVDAVITFNQSMPNRVHACNYPLWQQVMLDFPGRHKLFGPGNEAAGECNQGKVSYNDLKAAMRDHRAYFYVGTHPASYTLNFMEAWMTGIPVVAIGPRHGNATYFPGHELYEVSDLIESGVDGLWSDSVEGLRDHIRSLMFDREMAAKIGAAGRAKAISVFGKDVIAKQWVEYFGSFK